MSESKYQIMELTEKMWSIEDQHVRAFVVEGSQRTMLVDTGFGTADIKKTVESLTDKPIFLVNTHADRDHTGGNNAFNEVYMHPSEFDRYYLKKEIAVVPKAVWEGDSFDLGGMVFEVVLIPGHTPGSIALLEREKRILISGDSVQTGSIFMFGEGRNLPAYIESLKKLENMLNLFDTVYGSHGDVKMNADIIPPLRAGAEKLLAGELEAKELDAGHPLSGTGCMLYDCGVAGFLYMK